jgi:hypothetical protein
LTGYVVETGQSEGVIPSAVGSDIFTENFTGVLRQILI